VDDADIERTYRLAVARGLVYVYRCLLCEEEVEIVLPDLDIKLYDHPDCPEQAPGLFGPPDPTLYRVRKVEAPDDL